MIGARECLATVVANREIKRDHFLLTLRVPGDFAAPLPGQFVMLRQAPPLAGAEFYLPRPFSIHDYVAGCLELLFRRVGRVTTALAQLTPGQDLLVRGPLGNHFIIPEGISNLLVVVGGVGAAPLHFFVRYFRNRAASIRMFIGDKSVEELLRDDVFDSICNETRIATDDGSCGWCGLVTDLLPTSLALAGGDTAVYACGPRGMLQKLAEVIPDHVPCYVSLEERMACGIGACLGCGVETGGCASGKKTISRVCKDGPIFSIRDVVWGND